jgi:hypothetical protein
MRKRAAIFVLLAVVIAGVLAGAYYSLTAPHGKLVARLQKTDEGGYVHSVTVRQFAGRFRTELSDEGRPVRDLPVSSYEFYEGSVPIIRAIITWPEVNKFSVTFNNGVIIDCTWNETNCIWTRH